MGFDRMGERMAMVEVATMIAHHAT